MFWAYGRPRALKTQGLFGNIEIEKFCGYDLIRFVAAVRNRFKLEEYGQRFVRLEPVGATSFFAAQEHAMLDEEGVAFHLRRENDVEDVMRVLSPSCM